LLGQTLRGSSTSVRHRRRTTPTEAGYVCEDVENHQKRLSGKCDLHIEGQRGSFTSTSIARSRAKSDKPSLTLDVSGEGVQQALLKLIECTIASVPPQGGAQAPEPGFRAVYNHNILVVCGGASTASKRSSASARPDGLGFGAEVTSRTTARTSARSFANASPRT